MEQLHENEPRVIFVTGGPGTGKGTQCPKLVEAFGYKHVSIGDLCRAEIKSGSEEGKNILSIVQSGGLVPKELTISLLQKSLASINAHTILVDGFPRSVEQAIYLEQMGVKVNYLLHFDTDKEDILLGRLIERGKTSGRADDNEETIVKRFRIYKSESLPVLQLYEPFGIVRKVDCMGTINEVFFRTICAIRPEVLFVAGAKYSGKSTLSEFLGKRYSFYVLNMDRVLKKCANDDESITRKLVQTLQNFKHECRIIVDGFPQNLQQAKLFAGLIGQPNKLIYLECTPDACQERQLAQGKNQSSYIPSTTLSQLYLESVRSYSDLCKYYTTTLGENFIKIDSKNQDHVRKIVQKFVEPEVVLIRGNIRPCVMLYYKKLGFKIVNCVHLVELWRNARGLSLSDNQIHLHDDPEVIDILKDVIFSGNATSKFLLYNFALSNGGLITEFENKVCKISKVLHFYSTNDVPFDNVASLLYPRQSFYLLNSAGISYKRMLLEADVEKLEKVIGEREIPKTSSFVILLGPTMTGKSKAAQVLVECGMRIIDFAAVIEDTKQRLSTEEEPKEDLTFSEIIDGIIEDAKKNPFQTIVIDGIPPSDVILARDPAYPIPELGEEKAEDIAYDEDPSVQERVSTITKRVKILLMKINVLSEIHFKVPYEVLEKRARKKFETPEEEDLTNEQKAQIFESWMLGQSLYQKPRPNKYLIPEVVTFNTEKQSMPIISDRLRNIYKRKVILVESNCSSGYESVKKMIWKNHISYIDFHTLLEECQDPTSKTLLIKERAKSIPVRSRYVVLAGFPFQINEFQSLLQEFAFLEDVLGRLHIFFTFTTREQEVEINELNPSQRKNEGHSVMWNNSQSSSQYKIFYNYKGSIAQKETKVIDYTNYSKVIPELLDAMDNEKRLIYQFVLDENSARGFSSYLMEQGTIISNDFKEKLFMDFSNVDGKKKILNALKNRTAKDFHSRYLRAYTIPFSVFFEGFTNVLKDEKLNITPGLRKSIRESIDANKNYFIDAEEVNMFFDSWENSEERDMIINRGISNDRKVVVDKLGYQLIILIEETIPDPVTQCTSFSRGDTFELCFEGFKGSKRFCADRTVYFGKENSQFQNDIEFNSADTRFAISHFQIHSKKTGYYLVDNSSEHIVKLKVFEIPVVLYEDALIYLGEHEIRVNTCSAPKPTEDNSLMLSFRGKSTSYDMNPCLELEFLSEAMFGNKFTFTGKKIVRLGSGSFNDIVLANTSPFHALIELRPSGWCISDNHTIIGTLLSINTFSNIKYKKPSPSLKLIHGMRFAAAGVHFRTLHKTTSKIRIDVNSFNEFRSEKFTDFYTVIKHLGKSLLGEKMVVRHLQSKKHYWAKMIMLKDFTANVRTEVNILRELDHPNTAKVVDILIDGTKVYVITELCSGPELFEKIMSKGSHCEEAACKYIRQVLQGLAYLHSNEICHRDIRPENLQFSDSTDDAILKICDFANSIDNKGFVDKISGTSHYLAPEVFTGNFSKAADVWACGVVLYALLVGVPPFTGKTDADVRKKAVKGTPTYKEKAWSKVSNHAKRVVRLMLTFDHTKRPSAAELLVDPWIKQSLKSLDMSKPMIVRTFKNFKHFYSTNKLQQAIYMFMIQNLANEQTKKQAADMYTRIDKNGDGKVSVDELINAMDEMGVAMSENEIRTCISEVDANGSGWIDFSEFLTVFTSKNMMLSKENLESTFAMFDADGSGEISTIELKRVLGHNENEWMQIMKDIDENKDGKLDIKEFKNLLLRMG